MLPAEYSPEQLAEAWQRVRAYNQVVGRSIQTGDEKTPVSIIQEIEQE